MKMKFHELFLRLWFCSLLLASCRQIEVFEKNTPFPKYEWKRDFAATGSFKITDTSSSYNIYIILRHTDSYPYNNIWINVGLQPPGDTMYFQKLDLTLGNDANGWEGSGMNDIWEVRKIINGPPRRFRKSGEYRFNIKHIMRNEPLPSVMSAGLRIEKAL